MSEIKYALLVVSHPTWMPTVPELAEFLNKKLPELSSSSSAKIGFLVETCQLSSEFMTDSAINAFGSNVSDEEKYTYRTIHFGIDGGEVKILVAYIKSSNEGCFIATACCGSYESPEVMILRRYRDELLLNNRAGRYFVDIYYEISPRVAHFIEPKKKLKGFLSICVIEPIAKALSCLTYGNKHN